MTLLLAALLAVPVHAQLFSKTYEVKTGIDVLIENGFFELQGKRLGLITNHTGRARDGRLTADILIDTPSLQLKALFAPEHGFLGKSEENAISSDTYRGVPVKSLYAGGIAGMRLKAEDLKDLDAVVFDIQDIGARFYTYLASMGMALEECAKAKIPFIVLDRPNPINGEDVEGPILEDLSLRQVTSTAYFPVPIRHGMTAGEIAIFHNEEVKHPGLQVIKMKGWKRKLWWDQTRLPWIPTSPNMPDIEAATLYPGIGNFEASNIAVGRGTPIPFRWIGAPWMDAEYVVKRMKKAGLHGVHFSTQEFTPGKSVFAGALCRGVKIRITDREALNPVEVFVHLAAALRDRHPGQFLWRWDEAKRMLGTEAWRKLYEGNVAPAEIVKIFRRGPERFALERGKYLLY
jgi:uncharacterized protein YbbC (DUF1343 family)